MKVEEKEVVVKERALGRILARELSNEEVAAVSGGLDSDSQPGGDYTPTGKPEADCD